MFNTRNTLAIALLLNIIFSIPLSGQEAKLVSKTSATAAFSLTDCAIYYEQTDHTLIQKTAELLSKDIESVTGVRPKTTNKNVSGNTIIIGTLGRNSLIDQLVSHNKLDVSSIKGGWEQFTIQRVKNPFPNTELALVITGSDRRGTAYGAFTLSEAIGVSPWVWWADVPVKKQETLYIINDTTSKTPSIKYRGIFINDEDWGLKPWSANNYESELKDIGPKTYARVCELLLRLKGNMFAPAMHSCTGPFYSHPESKEIANDYGIIITTSHCEPLLFNNASKLEWDSKRDGEWNYVTNKNVILKKLDNRVKEAAPYENIYTVGMRGLHDEGMKGQLSEKDKVDVLEQIISKQRGILKKHLKKPSEELPQIFVPYKETMGIYEDGLKVPDDVTLVWVDDNFGYIKRLSTPEEQQRKGGAGVYYHFSYLGVPHDYLWVNTTPPVLFYEELKKAYDVGANRYWLVNVGDIKPSELGMQTFFELAWDIEKFNFDTINTHQSQFLATIFGEQYAKSFQHILDTYYRLAWSRKPEYMGWEREWDTPEYNTMKNTQYSFQNYNDAQQRLADYKSVSDLTDTILKQLPPNYQPAFFELLGYPVMASYQMNKKFLMAQLHHEKFQQNNYTEANWASRESKIAFDSIASLTKHYNTMLNGKWNHMMAIPPGFTAKYHEMPKLTHLKDLENTPVDITPKDHKNILEGCLVIDLKKTKHNITQKGHTLRLIEGIGYDWNAIQLGEAIEESANPKNLDGSRFEYEFSGVDTDSVTVYVHSIPIFPLHHKKSTTYGISIDDQTPFIAKNEPEEFSTQWKDQVLKNGVVATAKFSINKHKKHHKLSLICGDPGVIIQRIVIDWGGLKKTYVGPRANLSEY